MLHGYYSDTGFLGCRLSCQSANLHFATSRRQRVDVQICTSIALPHARAELTAKKRQILWESLREQESGGPQGATRIVGYKQPPENEKGFAAATAAAVGMSKKNINEYIRHA